MSVVEKKMYEGVGRIFATTEQNNYLNYNPYLKPLNHHKKCLLVDDDPDDQEIFCLALNEINYAMECVLAKDGVEAIEKLTALNAVVPDYIFLDFNMPRMNGLQCLQEIRKLRYLQDVPVIMCSTSLEPTMIKTSKESGANAFIIKPASVNQLTQEISKILELTGK